MSRPFSDHAPFERVLRWKRAAIDAEWNVPDGVLGKIVLQLRRRGKRAALRAGAVFGLLVCVILVGLAYYLGQPLWQVFSDGSRQALDEQRHAIADQYAGLYHRRSEIYSNSNGSAGLLELTDGLFIGLRDSEDEWMNAPLLANGRIFLTGSRGTMLRFDPASNSTVLLQERLPLNEALQRPFLYEEQLFVTGWGGSIFRLRPDSTEPERLRDPSNEILQEPVAFDGALYVAGRNGALLRIDPNAESGPGAVTTILAGTRRGEGLNPPVVFDGALFVTGRDGTVLRLDSDAEAPVEIDIGTLVDEALSAPIEANEALFISGSSGTILQMNANESVPRVIRQGTLRGEGFNPPVFFDNALYFSGTNGTILRQTASDPLPVEFRTAVARQAGLNRPLVFGDALYFSSHDGAILRLRSGAATIETIQPALGGEVFLPLILDGVLHFTDANGTILRIEADGGAPTPIQAPDVGVLNWPIPVDGITYFFGSNGSIRRSSEPEQAALAAISPALNDLEPGEFGGETDALSNAMDQLIANASPLPQGLTDLRRRLNLVNAQLEALNVTDTAVRTARQKFEVGFWALVSREDRAVSFAAFMESCGAISTAPNAETTTACITAYNTQSDQDGTPWWEILARQIPPGILLLFLLLTLGGLYRYNMRVAGFHHSRADLLEIIAMGRNAEDPLTKDEWEYISRTTDALAADKVAFGATRASVGPQGVSFDLSRLAT